MGPGHGCSIIQHNIDQIQTPLEFEIREIFIDSKDNCCGNEENKCIFFKLSFHYFVMLTKSEICLYIFIPPEQRSCWGVYWFHSLRPSVCPSVRPSVRPSRLPCPLLASTVLDGLFYSILATNDHYHERVCRTQWPLTLTYIFKVIRPWLRKSCPLCSVYSSGWIIFIFSTNDHYHSRVCRVLRFFQNLKIWIFEIFRPCPWKKKSIVLDGFFPYLAQMITNMRGSVACNDLWPWPISSRSFCLGLENLVRSIASTVLDGFFPYLTQMITTMRGCRTQWPLTLTYIFKVIRPWLRKSCPLCSVYSSGWILFTRGQFWPLGIVVGCVCLSVCAVSTCLSAR